MYLNKYLCIVLYCVCTVHTVNREKEWKRLDIYFLGCKPVLQKHKKSTAAIFYFFRKQSDMYFLILLN